MSSRIDIERRVVIPNDTFSSLSPLEDAGEKKPTKETAVIMTVGMTKLTR